MQSKFNTILKHPYLIFLVTIMLSLALFQQIKSKGAMETDLDKYMPQDHPAFVYSDQAEGWFDIKDGIIIAIENPEGIYNPGTLEKIKQLTKDLQKMDEIEKADVTSLYTADNILGTDDGMDVKSFYRRVPTTTEKLNELQQAVKSNDMVYGRLVSENEKVSVLIARINDDVFTQDFYQRILELGQKYEGPEIIHVAGSPIIEGTMALLGPADMKRMVPIVIAVIFLLLLLVLKSVKNTIFTFLVVAVSSIWTFGLMAAVGIPVYAVSTMIPVMLIAIGVADGIHLFSHLDLYLLKHPNATRAEASYNMLKEMWIPVVMTSVTTAIGFVSLLTSEVYPIKYFGLFTAFGVLAAMVLSLTLIPAGVMAFGFKKRKSSELNGEVSHNSNQISQSFTTFLFKYKLFIVATTVAIMIISIVGTTKEWINSSFLDKFEPDSEIVLTDKFINENFGGTSTLNLILESNDKNAFKNPEILEIVLDLQNDVETLPMVGSSFSLNDYLLRMNKVMHADSAQYESVPGNSDLIAQYLLLYEMSGDPEKLWQVTDYEYRKLNITFQLKSDNSKVINEALEKIGTKRSVLAAQGVTMNFAGSGYKGLVFTDLILEGQIKSLFISLVIIVLLLTLMFKDYRVGIIGSVPIIITALISFGVMGLLNIPLNTTSALLSSISVGIGIDYAVHFIDRYRANLAKNTDSRVALEKTMSHSGRAIIFNAIVVILGFMVLLASVFPPNRQLGGLVSLNMFTSFVGTLTIMVLLLKKFKIFQNKNKE